MIVVDTNVIAYFYLPSDRADEVNALFQKDCSWMAPFLWRSEFRNLLNCYLKEKRLSLSQVLDSQREAEFLLAGNEYHVDSSDVLALAAQSGCSAYDCEFVSLAIKAKTILVTYDKKLLRAFPEVAKTAASCIT
jgi:predicted nucleic acid-binding protein